VRELGAGVWPWHASRPEWTAAERWPQEVSSYAVDDGERSLLFDPLSVPDRLLALARGREPVIVLTALPTPFPAVSESLLGGANRSIRSCRV